MISIAIYNGSNNTVGGGCYSAQQAVSKFPGHNIDMVSWVHCKCQTRAGVSANVDKTFECVTITDSKFSNRVLVWMTPKSTSRNCLTIWLEQMDFCFKRWNENFLTSIFQTAFCLRNCFLIFLPSRQSAVMTCPIGNETPRRS